jgi:hypothetical protein
MLTGTWRWKVNFQPRRAAQWPFPPPQEMNAEADIHLLDLIRIRKVRTEMLAAMNLAKATPDECSASFLLHRYESRARTRRRRARAQLERNGKCVFCKTNPIYRPAFVRIDYNLKSAHRNP